MTSGTTVALIGVAIGFATAAIHVTKQRDKAAGRPPSRSIDILETIGKMLSPTVTLVGIGIGLMVSSPRRISDEDKRRIFHMLDDFWRSHMSDIDREHCPHVRPLPQEHECFDGYPGVLIMYVDDREPGQLVEDLVGTIPWEFGLRKADLGSFRRPMSVYLTPHATATDETAAELFVRSMRSLRFDIDDLPKWRAYPAGTFDVIRPGPPDPTIVMLIGRK